jgi:FAD/FMN-containing dehydrogenase
VIAPGSPGYDTARLVWNRRFDDVRQMAVVRPSGAEDVRGVVEFARDLGLP